MNIKNLPDSVLIHEGNLAQSIRWYGGQQEIDQELESRFLDVKEELEWHKEWQELDDALLSL